MQHAIAQLRLCCELLCESHNKRKMPKRISNLITALSNFTSQQKMTDKRVQMLTTALFLASDATQEDFQIVDGKIYIDSPMHIDPQELARRVIW